MMILAVVGEILAVSAAVIGFSFVSRRLDPGREPGAAGTAPASPRPAHPSAAGGAGAQEVTGPFGYDNGVMYDRPGGGVP